MVDWQLVREKAKEVREKYSLSDGPVNAFEIAKRAGIKVAYFKPKKGSDIEDASGLFVAKQKTIYLNADESADRQNFTLAHELAHYFLQHKPNEYGVYWRNTAYSDGDKPEKEQEADCFAAELLMPKVLIERLKKLYGLKDDNVVALAKLLGVSPSAMKYRLMDIRNGRATD